jgi:AraC family transcriptional regulator
MKRQTLTLASVGDKYNDSGCGRVLQSSALRGWSSMLAESRLHLSGHFDGFVQPVTEVSMVIRGEGLMRKRASGETLTTHAGPGVIWLCSQGEQTEWLELEHGALEVLHVYLRPDAWPEYATEQGPHGAGAAAQSLRPTVTDPLLEQINRAILAEMEAETAGGSLLIESLCNTLSARLLQSHSMSPLDTAARLSSTGKLDFRRLSRVLEYIHAHLGEALDIRGMASTANLSRFHFARAFKASTGQTPYEYVRAKRLAQAKVLLAQNRPLAEIALALNFSSQANFTRAFRREFGITPGQYREQMSR